MFYQGDYLAELKVREHEIARNLKDRKLRKAAKQQAARTSIIYWRLLLNLGIWLEALGRRLQNRYVIQCSQCAETVPRTIAKGV